MYRVTTNGNYNLVMSNIMLAQQKQIDAGDRVATQKNGSNLKEYARSAEMLTAMRSVEARLGGYLDQNKLIADKLTTQDFALTQLGDDALSERSFESALRSRITSLEKSSRLPVQRSKKLVAARSIGPLSRRRSSRPWWQRPMASTSSR